ncbi:HAD family hydrolase [Bowdeniella massiliensis]|uniref:HAD family hydrolase n=1 Tax=Bowdeniella massiliensis TaxID=2932264 RepID=UPI0020284391
MRVFLWDLDGTLIDSGATIIGSIRQALAACGLPDVPEEQARGCVGPPLIEGLPRFCGVPLDAVHDVIAEYRRIYGATMTSAPIYPEVIETIEAASRHGVIHAIATAKPEVAAREILAAKNLTDHFAVITGADPTRDINHKEQVVELCLNRLTEAGIETSAAVMIGDRRYDMEGARVNGIDAVFVAWGYGSPSEADGFPIVHAPSELLAEWEPALGQGQP